MNRLAIFIVLAGSLVGLISHSAGANTPPAPSVNFGVSHAQPVAGHNFVGFVVTPANGASLVSVNCDTTLDGKDLAGHTRHFYNGGSGPYVAISCGWNIPAKAHGTITLRVAVITSVTHTASPVERWHVRQ